ncbi:reticulocyte-binding protein homolog 2a [Eurosta solidaginis]|uniref:reticulocyte-binding protein homolog 2a n=1 Tax=Eurosta solidaginis TaxID=178769 RepID=UPI003530B88D
MAASVLFACGLNEQKLPAFVHISEESNVDGSFLISSILGQRLRISNAGTVLVCLQHNYQHYFHAGMRLGYNANIFNGKTLHVVDPLTEMARNGITCKWLRDERLLTNTLLEAIRNHINTNVAQRNSITVLIDNLAILLNLGATKEDIIWLCHDLAELPKQYENLTVITKMSNCDLYEPLDNNVAKLGTLRIRAAQLKSGVSRDVDGKLLIEREVIENSRQQSMKKRNEILVTEKEKELEKEYEQNIDEAPMLPMEKDPEQDLKKEEIMVEGTEQLKKEKEALVEEKEEVKREKKSPEKDEEPAQKKQQKTVLIQELRSEKDEDEMKWNKQEKMDIEQNDGYVLEIVRKEVLYKVNDRSIKILSPGEVGVRV